MLFSRRAFINLGLAVAFLYRLPATAATLVPTETKALPETVKILKQAFAIEMIAHKRYLAGTDRAISESYPNIAYLFWTFSISEKIHADNYLKLLTSFNETINTSFSDQRARDTKTNLRIAARQELEKIDETYPGYLQALEFEAHDDAITHCMYSWKSHRQHEQKIREIHRYSGMFFGTVAKKIEGLQLDFHVCKVCGSTIDHVPLVACEICNKSKSNYQQIERPSS